MRFFCSIPAQIFGTMDHPSLFLVALVSVLGLLCGSALGDAEAGGEVADGLLSERMSRAGPLGWRKREPLRYPKQ